MPNHCYQQVHIRGPREIVKEIYEHLELANPVFCQLIKPMPFNTFVKPRVKLPSHHPLNVGTDGLAQCSTPAWYDWRCDNWGTKWDVCNVEIMDEGFTDLGNPLEDDCEAEFAFNCWTAWAPPIPVWSHLVDLGIKVDADYQDEGGMFEGRYVNGDDECWEPIEEGEDEDA